MGTTQEGDVLNLGFKPFDGAFMRSFIKRARSYEPMIDDALQRDIVDAYVSMRDDEKRAEIDSRKSYTTPRTLLAILRLMQASKESVELSAPAKKGANPLDLVHDIIADLSRRADNTEGWVEMAH